jgi:hypothetical protein
MRDVSQSAAQRQMRYLPVDGLLAVRFRLCAIEVDGIIHQVSFLARSKLYHQWLGSDYVTQIPNLMASLPRHAYGVDHD